MRGLKVRSAGIAAGLTAAAVVGLQGTSYAADATKDVRAEPGNQVFVVPFWKVGDCHFQGNVEIKTDGVYLTAKSLTEHTNHADIWHSTFTFYDANRNVLFTSGPAPYDSPPMVPAGGASSGPSNEYDWKRVGPLPANYHGGAVGVIWKSSC